ncbi:MAG: hypothetical protein JW753_11645 [Dehalococcoidia bacterium]|nr:hypothetical protein [Dehalococcoidia bacterium]
MIEKVPLDLEVLAEMLALGPGQTFLLIFDRFGHEVAELICETATKMRLPFCARFIPMSTQLQYASENTIPADLQSCLKQHDALIFVVSDQEDCTRFRAKVLTVSREAGGKILHMPGVDLALITETLSGFDVARVHDTALRLGGIFDQARTVEISTVDRKGILHKLQLDIEGRELHYDTGMLAPGRITQIPTGELYIAPQEDSAEGSIVINGSAPERVFRNNNVVVLRCTKGVVNIEKSFFSDTIECRGFKRELVKYKAQDRRNLTVGELGIGLNPSIMRLTGKPIHDEKAAGTAHIALGDNTPFGGNNDCDCHVDLIFVPEKITVDGVDAPLDWGLRRRDSDATKTA